MGGTSARARCLRPVSPKTLLATAAALALCAQPAAADQLESTLNQGIYEVSHTVAGKIVDGVATLKVRRVFANPGQRADEASLAIDLPPGAAATGLRIRARSTWYEAELMEAGKAAALYQELTGLGAYKPKDPALLQWQWADKLHLQIFPVLPGAVSTVEYTLTMPTHYRQGSYLLSYPRAGEKGLVPPVVALAAPAGAAIVVDGHPAAADVPVVIGPRPAPEWAGEGEPDPAASYVMSDLEVSLDAAVSKAKVNLDIDHTYRSDLEVELVTPQGKHVTLIARGGGDANGLRGHYPVELPAGTRARGTWHLLVSDHAALDTGTLNAWSLELERAGAKPFAAAAADTPRFIPDAPEGAGDGGLVELRLPAPKIELLAGRLGRVQASAAHGFARLELDVAPRLSELPKHAQVVFVLDGSRSIEQVGIDAQLDLARAYLLHVPDAEVEVVVYRRAARRLFGGFVPARDFAAHVAAARAAGLLEPGNGSALELGAAAAAAALAGRRGPARIVLASDALLRDAFTNQLALHALAGAPAGTIVHVVLPQQDGDLGLRRDDKHALAALAKPSGGILAELEGMEGRTLKELQPVVLGLVRPIRLDHVAIAGIDLTGAAELPDGLGEGAEYRAMVASKAPPAKVTVSGQLWSKSVSRSLTDDAAFDRATAAFVFSEDDYHELSNGEMMKLALLGRAVSPVTSYLAVEPGTRPSTIGLLRGLTGHGSGGGAGYGYGSGEGVTRNPDVLSLLRPGVAACLEHHPAPAAFRQEITVETTYHEVVDVAAPGSGSLHDCIVEAAWALDLGPEFRLPHTHYTVTVP